MTDIILKDGSTTEDPRLTRLGHFDPRSRSYAVSQVVPKRYRYRSRYWAYPKPYVLDQGAEGACVGFAVTNELLSAPVSSSFGGFQNGQRFARSLYFEAQKLDPWPGGAYPGAEPFYEGTTILAGTKAARNRGYIESFYWAFSLEEFVVGTGNYGPSVLGVPWFDSMYQPDSNHFIRPTGRIVGGHAIVARGVRIVAKRPPWWCLKDSWGRKIHREVYDWEQVDLDRSYVTLHNSWGPSYGKNGVCYISLRDLEVLLQQQGEAVFFEGRKAIHS